MSPASSRPLCISPYAACPPLLLRRHECSQLMLLPHLSFTLPLTEPTPSPTHWSFDSFQNLHKQHSGGPRPASAILFWCSVRKNLSETQQWGGVLAGATKVQWVPQSSWQFAKRSLISVGAGQAGVGRPVPALRASGPALLVHNGLGACTWPSLCEQCVNRLGLFISASWTFSLRRVTLAPCSGKCTFELGLTHAPADPQPQPPDMSSGDCQLRWWQPFMQTGRVPTVFIRRGENWACSLDLWVSGGGRVWLCLEKMDQTGDLGIFQVMIDKREKFCQLMELKMTNEADVFNLQSEKNVDECYT